MITGDPKLVAIVATIALLLVVGLARRRLFDLTCTGVFFFSYLVFVVLGVLACPWLIEGYLQESFSYLRWGLITPQDLNVTTLTITSGLILFLAGSYTMDFIYRRSFARWLGLLRIPEHAIALRLGMSPRHLLVTYVVLTLVAAALLATRLPAILEGFHNAYIKLDHGAYYSVREKVQELGLPYYLIIYNALPFCTQALFLADRLSGNAWRRRASFLWFVAPVFFLLLTFEKTALILFVLVSGLTFLLGQLYGRRLSLPVAETFSAGQLARALYRMRRQLWMPLAAAVLVLMVLYTLTTDSITNQGSVLGIAGKSLLVVLDRICLRLAVMPLLYAHYFPHIEPFYGLANVGKLSFITGIEYYPDTVKVLHYFTGLEEGGGAIGSLTDFFSAFGWPGLFLGSFLLGMVLRATDNLLRGMPPTILNRVLWLYLLYVSWYLSQASVFRCLSSYGGAVFLGLWLVFSLGRTPSMMSPHTRQPSAS